MIRILLIVAIFFTSITTSYSQFDEIEMDDSQIIEEDPQYKLSPQEQAYLDKIDQYVDYFFDFTEN